MKASPHFQESISLPSRPWVALGGLCIQPFGIGGFPKRRTSKEEIMHPDRKEFHNIKSLFCWTGVAVLAVLVPANFASAQSASNTSGTAAPKVIVKYVHTSYTPAHSGKQMYTHYCAGCHGELGQGNGPASPTLKEKPTNLSLLTVHNGGKFPRHEIAQVLTASEKPHVRGTTSMPDWLPAFRAMDSDLPALATLRVHNLVSYLETLQVPNPNAVPLPLQQGTSR
jgi:mono/diheme cytochrome c family protein